MLDEPQRELWLPAAEILKLLHPPRGARVLDYGTGTARYTIEIASARPDVSIVAYDVQDEMLAIARERVREADLRNVVVAGRDSGETHPFWFDRILALNVLHEIGLDELRRLGSLLKIGAYALIVDWDARVPRDFGPPPKHVYSLQEACAQLSEAGFSCDEIVDKAFPYHFAIRAAARG
jgi:SAM-dependent methyltransferase